MKSNEKVVEAVARALVRHRLKAHHPLSPKLGDKLSADLSKRFEDRMWADAVGEAKAALGAMRQLADAEREPPPGLAHVDAVIK
jgi:hypothetical protein